MWTSFTRDTPSMFEPPNTLAAFCELYEYLNKEEEYLRIRKLVMDNLWAKIGKAY